MQPILIYYLAGLSIALLIGAICYYTVGHAATPLLRAVFGAEASRMWGRLFRIALVTFALVGALTTKFYGCRGPTDYAAVAQSHELMLEHTTNQVAASLESCQQYLLLTAALVALAFAAARLRKFAGPAIAVSTLVESGPN